MKTLLMTMAVAGACAMQAVVSGCRSGCCMPNGGQAVCTPGSCTAQPAMAMATHKEGVINTEALATLLRAKVPVTVLDARTGKYDDGRRVPGAKTLDPAAKDADVTTALPDKTALIVTYCAGLKCPASHMLGEKLRGLGYLNVLEYHEGIDGWVAAGNTVEHAAK